MKEELTDQAFSKKIGEHVQKLRREQRVSREKLAEDSGLSTTGVAYIERGEKSPNIQTLRKVVSALGTTLWQFFAAINE